VLHVSVLNAIHCTPIIVLFDEAIVNMGLNSDYDGQGVETKMLI